MIATMITYIIVLLMGVIFFDKLKNSLFEFVCDGYDECDEEILKNELNDTLPIIILLIAFLLIPFFNIILMCIFIFYSDIVESLINILNQKKI